MDRRFDEITSHLIDIKSTLARNSVVLERNVEDIAHHIKRTDKIDGRLTAVELPYKAVKWVGGALIGFAAVLAAIVKIFGLV